MDYPSMLLSGSLLIIAIVFFWLWIRAENRLKQRSNETREEEQD
jgi:hypothetical protein